ncbi:translation initiation factor 2 [Actinomyces sp. 2119]|uniref:LppM family (lipo)protein n=1 Tax=Actinomyces sp. 2119 TaxID=2321393 RepID=UPI000E6D100A|nr:translation initiation factor 2 [Actinomyces sp. 2119]RJF41898.1 translation initiation factor 2 [Actinomyces sp. 2119]
MSQHSRPHRLGRPAVSCALACLALSGCTLEMDMTITPTGTYDITLEMRDTTGEVIGSEGDCATMADPEVLEVSQDAQVEAEPLSGGNDEVGCLVTITGVAVPEASEAGEGAIVVRDGDVYTVNLAAPDLGGDPAALDPTQGDQDTTGGSTAASFNTLVDTRVSVTFPGSVTEAEGGSVSGRTVTWEDADALTEGVTASGYAEQSRDTSWTTNPATWVTAALVMTGAALGLVVAARRRGAQRPRRTREKQRKAGRGRQITRKDKGVGKKQKRQQAERPRTRRKRR